ncbi:MAG: hypothetical protein ABI475_02970 [Methylophilaceae bacterium]
MRYLLMMLILLPGITVAADSLDRLFTTPAERASLDYLRQTRKIEVLEADKSAEAAPAVPSSISVQGYVKRSDGTKGTVWINQAPVQEGTSSADMEVGKLRRDSNQVQLKLPATGKMLNLKAGQVYVPETDSVSEVNAHTKVLLLDNGEDVGSIGESPKNADVASKNSWSIKTAPPTKRQ